jgi:hypothetical protein
VDDDDLAVERRSGEHEATAAHPAADRDLVPAGAD